MQVSQNNIYSNGRIFDLESGEYLLNIQKFVWVSQPTDLIHTLVEGETLDKLAWFYYNNKRANAEKYWWLIAKANYIQNPFQMANYTGKSILIPDILLLDFVLELQA